MSKLNDLATEPKLAPLTAADIESLHRLASKPNKIPVVILRFSSRITRDEWMEKRSHLKATKSVVYFLDNLTALNKKQLWMMGERCAEKQYQYAWQVEGKLFSRKADGQCAIRIETEADLDKMC
ncbi:hypothetical protein HPB48_001429 [Haemaphysalis longicornis]|uniref:FP protein C-terminal domain-containing protein n=1 Tax=Haemaphysalis longicornis TaxID=44386 RepID=A0A9J6G9P7_HAELO|nr:hypothetical protein HPB48_001429 [Haemaphysalis longicornis]